MYEEGDERSMEGASEHFMNEETAGKAVEPSLSMEADGKQVFLPGKIQRKGIKEILARLKVATLQA